MPDLPTITECGRDHCTVSLPDGPALQLWRVGGNWHMSQEGKPTISQAATSEPAEDFGELPPGPWRYMPDEFDDWGVVRDSKNRIVAKTCPSWLAEDFSKANPAFDETRKRGPGQAACVAGLLILAREAFDKPAAATAGGVAEKYTKLRDACQRAEMGIMETSGDWSLHDVSERGKELEQQTLDIVNKNVDLEADNARLTTALREAGERAEKRDRAIFDAGFRACRGYGDNHFHYRGEQADRVFAKAMERIQASEAEGAIVVDGRTCLIHNRGADGSWSIHDASDEDWQLSINGTWRRSPQKAPAGDEYGYWPTESAARAAAAAFAERHSDSSTNTKGT